MTDIVASSEAARVRQGAAAKTEPDVLLELANDPSVTVRAALALNQAAPSQANAMLAGDSDERVRILLARKLATLAPGLSVTDQARLYRETWDTLSKLVADTAVRVRSVIAEAVKELPNAPRTLVLRLAHDAEISVSARVIELSPLLTTEDLLALLANAPADGVAIAVARRTWLEPEVADAVAASVSGAAIHALLANPTAQIREATLDALIARSVRHPEWHGPLVRRPSLPPRAARMLSDIVAAHLLAELANRADLAPPLAEELRRRIDARLAADATETPQSFPAGPTEAEVLVQARALASNGELTEEKLLEAVRCGDLRSATALLAVAASTPVAVVERASSLRSAKGLVSLVWKAGFTMRAAVAVQTLFARLSPDAVLTAGPGGAFPLTVEEMRWQLDFLGRVGR